jgi:hypothetical protein
MGAPYIYDVSRLRVNNTNIAFSNNETTFLQKGLKYNLHTKKKNWIQNLALEAETAISQLPTNEREFYRKLVADRIEKMQRQHNSNTTHNTHPEAKLIKSIQPKLQQSNTTITRANKGNSIITLPTKQYETKIQNSLHSNNFHTATTDPTKNFQPQIRKTVKESKTLIPHDTRWKYINMNPSAPSIKELIKIHKPYQSIRAVVN